MIAIIIISIFLGSAAIAGAIIYLSSALPMRYHRNQLNQLISHTHSRTLSPQERQLLTRYLSLTPAQYNSLLGGNNRRNDQWTGKWTLKSDQVYAIKASFRIEEPDPSETPLFRHRFGKIGRMRFNIPPIWEHAENSLHQIEFVLTDKLPVVIRIDEVSLDQGIRVIDEYLESKEAIDAFQHGTNEPLTSTAPDASVPDIPRDKSAHSFDDVHKQNEPHDDARESHQEKRVKSFTVTRVRQLSREEALTVYGPMYHVILALIALVSLVATIWSGTLETARGEPLSFLAALVCGTTLIMWKMLPFWIMRPTVKTLQGQLTARVTNPSQPQYRALSIGELVFETNARNKGLAVAETHGIQNQLGRSIEVELTPERYILSYQGQSYITYYRRPNLIKYLFGGACIALLIALITAHLLSASLDIPVLWKGPRHITLSTLEEAQHYQPADGDILTFSQLPVLCGINKNNEPDCDQMMPGKSSPIDLTMDKKALALINPVRQSIDRMYKESRISYISQDNFVWLYSASKANELATQLHRMCVGKEKCASLAMVLPALQKAPHDYYSDSIVLSSKQYDALQTGIRNLLRLLESQAAYRPLEALKAQRAHAPWQLNSFPLGHNTAGVHLYQGGLMLLKTERVFDTPAPTGDSVWDDVMARFATEQSGTLTITGQVENLKKTSPPTFALNLVYYLPPVWPIGLALVAWLILLGLTVYSGVTCRRRFGSKRSV